VPAVQLEQALELDAEKEPDEHVPVTAVNPVDAQYDPAGHAVQKLELIEA